MGNISVECLVIQIYGWLKDGSQMVTFYVMSLSTRPTENTIIKKRKDSTKGQTL